MKALYAGSFDPITNGHLDIIAQATALFSTVVIGVATNPDKTPLFPVSTRIEMIMQAITDIHTRCTFKVTSYRSLTVAVAAEYGAQFLVRGLRAVSDFDSEFQMVQFNRKLWDQRINTVFLMPDESNFYLSSTAIRGIAKLGGDVDAFVPTVVARNLEKIYGVVDREHVRVCEVFQNDL